MDGGQVVGESECLRHGAAVGDNTLHDRAGARTGLITAEGFEDTLQRTHGANGRWAGQTEDQIKHHVASDRPEPLVAIEEICGVSERVD